MGEHAPLLRVSYPHKPQNTSSEHCWTLLGHRTLLGTSGALTQSSSPKVGPFWFLPQRSCTRMADNVKNLSGELITVPRTISQATAFSVTMATQNIKLVSHE